MHDTSEFGTEISGGGGVDAGEVFEEIVDEKNKKVASNEGEMVVDNDPDYHPGKFVAVIPRDRGTGTLPSYGQVG